jgi:hypothetical protein
MTLRKRDDTRTLKGKCYVVLCGERALEEAVDLMHDRLRDL